MEILKNSRLYLGLYALVSAGTAFWSALGGHAIEYVCKPLMMAVLSLWFFFNSRRYGDRFTLFIQAGLFFSLVGDVALMFQHLDEFNFLIGLGAFLIAQLCYCIAFLHNITEVGGGDGWTVSLGIAVVIVLFAVLFAWELVPRLDDGLSVPVIAYISIIACMAVLAGFRWMRTFPRSFWLIMIGALLFMASDSLLAFNRSIRPFGGAHTAIILTYAAAQLLIAIGALAHVLDPDSIRRKQAMVA